MIKKINTTIADFFLADKAQPRIDATTITQMLPWLYRSGQLLENAEGELTERNIRTIINLRYFSRKHDRQQFSHLGIDIINTPLKSWWITPRQVAVILCHLHRAQTKGNVLIHCYHGADRTGLVLAFFRIIVLGWDIDKAKAEMLNSPYGYHGIWKNIPRMLNAKTIARVRDLYVKLCNNASAEK